MDENSDQLELDEAAEAQREREAEAAAAVKAVTDSRDAAELRGRELADGDPVSDNVVGQWAVYDNSLLQFWPGLPTFTERADAQRELDSVRPTTGHDLVVVEV